MKTRRITQTATALHNPLIRWTWQPPNEGTGLALIHTYAPYGWHACSQQLTKINKDLLIKRRNLNASVLRMWPVCSKQDVSAAFKMFHCAYHWLWWLKLFVARNPWQGYQQMVPSSLESFFDRQIDSSQRTIEHMFICAILYIHIWKNFSYMYLYNFY